MGDTGTAIPISNIFYQKVLIGVFDRNISIRKKCKSYLNFVSGVMKSMPGRKFWDEKLYRKCNYAKESHSICKNWDLFTYHKENAIPLLPPGKRSV